MDYTSSVRTEVIDRNLETALSMLEQQTHQVTGGATGCCFSLNTVALTGKFVPFPVTTEREQMLIERNLGVTGYGVIPLRNQSVYEILPTILKQKIFSLDAVIVRGSVESDKHRVTVIPANDSAQFHVIDSLIPGARAIYADEEEVITYLKNRFDEKLPVRLFVTASEQEKRKGTLLSTYRLPISDDVAIQIVPLH